MVKSSSMSQNEHPSSSLDVRVVENTSSMSLSSSSSSCKFKGVRKRKWGKYVSEIRLPNSRERIWLGSYDTAEKAARAFDAAAYCLRGKNAKFNFPDNPPEIVNGRSMTPAEIQVAAAQYARLDTGLDSNSESLSSCDQRAESPCRSVSGGAGQLDIEVTDIPFGNDLLNQFSALGTESNNLPDFGLFPEYDNFPGNFLTPHVPSVDDWADFNNTTEELNSHIFSLWNF